jgi:zinc/manganese transport system substrate-binding protein
VNEEEPMRLKSIETITLIVLALALFTRPLTTVAETPETGRLTVIATHSILGDLIHNVAGDAVDLTTLVGPDGDTHTYEPVPADTIKVAEADLLFENGLGFETWLDDLYDASGSQAQRIVVTSRIVPLGFAGEGVAANEAPVASPAPGQELDPHFWQDVANSESAVEVIRDALIAADPANAEVYQSNATAYLKQLQQLDDDIVTKTASLPVDRRKLVTNHDAFGYFAYRYGYTIEGAALQSFSTEAADPSAQQLAELVTAIRETGVPAIFPESIENADLVDRIAKEAGVKVGAPLYSDALGQPGSDGDTYLKLMGHNIDAIVSALQ